MPTRRPPVIEITTVLVAHGRASVLQEIDDGPALAEHALDVRGDLYRGGRVVEVSKDWSAPESAARPGSASESVPRPDGGCRALASDRLAEHLGSLFRAAYALCGSREEADDLVQETYARVLRRARWLRHGSERAYLMRVLRNVWYDTLNSGSRRREIPTELAELEFVSDARADPDLLLETRAAYAAIAGLSAPLRETIVAVDILGLSYKEAARALRTGEGTIMSRLYNARRKAAEAMQEGLP
jgi:RNA polymerase sigma-70 factor (ECF subfamily)